MSGIRSRQGCWTCRQRRKKCDESKPVCKRCATGNFECLGYEIRLTWDSSTPALQSKGNISKPDRRSRQARAADRLHRARRSEHLAHGDADDTFVEEANYAQLGEHDQQGELDVLSGLHNDDRIGTFTIEPVSSEVEATLLRNFTTSGYLSLTGRGPGQTTLFSTDILPMCELETSLGNVCIAYQSLMEGRDSLVTVFYLERALCDYIQDLNDEKRMMQDSTLTTGILLCSVSVASPYIWTPLLDGLHWMLKRRGITNPLGYERLSGHLLEVVALLDMPCWTINRVSHVIGLWLRHVKPFRSTGVEQTSGLPYSLLNVMADLNSSQAEQDLWKWHGEIAVEFRHIHWWEAVRMGAILHARALRIQRSVSTDNSASACDNVILMRLFASIDAILSQEGQSDTRPMLPAVLYPLFIGGLHTAEDSLERKTCERAFKSLETSSKSPRTKTAIDVVRKTWRRMRTQSDSCGLYLAKVITAELKIELHLY